MSLFRVYPMRRGVGLIAISATLASAAACMSSRPAPAPVPKARFDYSPAGCEQSGSTKLTFAVVAPRWQSPTQHTASSVQYTSGAMPQVYLDLTNAMRGDFLELATCRGYLARGPFDSFEAMVFPDREASNLLLEPELMLDVTVTDLEVAARGLGALLRTSQNQITGNASVGGRITLNVKEPVTNTRMWTRSIEVPSEKFVFTSEKRYATGELTKQEAAYLLLDDPGFLRILLPKLEATYATVFKTADSYLHAREMATVAGQAAEVRKKAAIGVPR